MQPSLSAAFCSSPSSSPLSFSCTGDTDERATTMRHPTMVPACRCWMVMATVTADPTDRTATPRGRPLPLLCLSEAVTAELLKYCPKGLFFTADVSCLTPLTFDGSCLKQSLPNYWTEGPHRGSGLCCSCVLFETVIVEQLDRNAAPRNWPFPLMCHV